ncbi:MAG: hypothetical protein KKA07_10745 [Bacteroidetes bacterium]|nr:hypothetical protein [Bacteroidota bacterium]MBU1719535.1 hypothetical protein [Bacteroidota bacterium]
MKRTIKIIALILSLIGVIVLLSFVDRSSDHKEVHEVKIKIDSAGGNRFVTENIIWQKIVSMGDSLKGIPFGEIDFPRIEKVLTNIPSVENAEVFAYITGDVKIDVKQRHPIVRVHNNFGERFYIDGNGRMMDLSDNYTAPVVIALGNINEHFVANRILDASASDTIIEKSKLTQIYILARFLEENPFWEAQTDQILVNSDGELELYPRVGGHTILLGDVSDLEEKFYRLMVFYKKGLSMVGWDKYRLINLKFRNQIVCTKTNNNGTI